MTVYINEYSTALKKNSSTPEPTPNLSSNKICRFDWSSEETPPNMVYAGDFMYCEPSWRAGFYKYNGKGAERFKRFMKNLDALAIRYSNMNKPAIIVCGKESRPFLNPTSCLVKARIMVKNKIHSEAFAYCYNFFVPPFRTEPVTNYEIIEELYRRGLRTAFDPCAGYGQLYDDFPNLIATDVRQECLNEIIRHRRELGYENL